MVGFLGVGCGRKGVWPIGGMSSRGVVLGSGFLKLNDMSYIKMTEILNAVH